MTLSIYLYLHTSVWAFAPGPFIRDNHNKAVPQTTLELVVLTPQIRRRLFACFPIIYSSRGVISPGFVDRRSISHRHNVGGGSYTSVLHIRDP